MYKQKNIVRKKCMGQKGMDFKHKEVIKTVGELFVGYFAAKKVASGALKYKRR